MKVKITGFGVQDDGLSCNADNIFNMLVPSPEFLNSHPFIKEFYPLPMVEGYCGWVFAEPIQASVMLNKQSVMLNLFQHLTTGDTDKEIKSIRHSQHEVLGIQPFLSVYEYIK